MNRKRTKLKSINLISVIFFLLASTFYLVHEQYPFLRKDKSKAVVPVVTVHDGDTVSIVVEKKKEKIRLIGIDAPETGQKPWGEKAKQYLESLISASGWRVKMEFDVEKRDQHGRILAYLWTTDGILINLVMVKNGYAMLYTFPPNVRYSDELRKGQKEARDRRLGIWGEEGLKERPGDYRREHPRI
jgi:micrococcal nuclease